MIVIKTLCMAPINGNQGIYLNQLNLKVIALIAISEYRVELPEIECSVCLWGVGVGRISIEWAEKRSEHCQAPFSTWRELHNS